MLNGKEIIDINGKKYLFCGFSKAKIISRKNNSDLSLHSKRTRYLYSVQISVASMPVVLLTWLMYASVQKWAMA